MSNIVSSNRRMLNMIYGLAFTDGVALLGLVLIAVPLKRLAGWPILVSILGPIHGVLFISLVTILIYSVIKRVLPSLMAIKIILLAFIPLGGFYADYLIKKYIQQNEI